MKYLVLLILPMVCFVGCTQSNPIQTLDGLTQGTTYSIRFWSKDSLRFRATATKDLELIRTDVAEELAAIDIAISNYRSDSIVERFNQMTDNSPFEVGTEIVNLIKRAQEVNAASHGCYDVTIKPLFDLWGFNGDSFKPADPQKIAELLNFVGINKVKIADPTHLQKMAPEVRVDLSSIGQGYSVARLAQILERHGIKNYMVEIGGELQVRGVKPNNTPWRIALERPLPGERTLQKVVNMDSTQSAAIMTSGTYRHYFDVNGVRYSHILDARTGYPVSHSTVSVTVFYADATMADAWSTALLCLGKVAGVKVANEFGIPALFIEQELIAQQGNELIETYSEPLKKYKGITIQ